MTNLPPHDAAAERSLLGGLFRDPEVLHAIRAIVSPETFYLDPHQRIFGAVCELADRAAPVDMASVASLLLERGQFENVGGAEYLADLFEGEITGASAEYHARTVRDCATIRELIHAATVIARDAQDRAMPADELLAAAERAIFAIAESRQTGRDNVRPISEVMRDVMRQIDERAANGGKLPGVTSGYTDLDEQLGGFRPGELVVIGARPSVGKTALALNMASNAARDGYPAFIASLEMPASELAGRMLSMGSGVPMCRITRGAGLSASEAESIARAASSRGLGSCPIYVDDQSDQPSARLASVARRVVRQRGVRLIVVDYLQLLRPENPRENRTQQVGMLALRMKHMARDCNVPVLLLSQLNRELEHGNRRPRLSDLRESGDIEAHADRVLLLHRDTNLDMNSSSWPIDVIVAKNRNGPIGDVRLLYQRPVMRFENYLAGAVPGDF